MEYWASKADGGQFLFSARYYSYKNRSNSTKASTPWPRPTPQGVQFNYYNSNITL